MDTFFLEIVVAVVALSFLPPDWEKHAQTTGMQVGIMALGLLAIGVYVFVRPCGWTRRLGGATRNPSPSCRQRPMGLSSLNPSYEAVSHHQKQIGVAGLLAACGHHGVNLAAVMGLVIEEVRHQE